MHILKSFIEKRGSILHSSNWHIHTYFWENCLVIELPGWGRYDVALEMVSTHAHIWRGLEYYIYVNDLYKIFYI